MKLSNKNLREESLQLLQQCQNGNLQHVFSRLDNDTLFEIMKELKTNGKGKFSQTTIETVLYQIRKSKCALCIVVPTYNRPRHIQSWLEKMHYYYMYGVDVLFVDSSDNDETEKLIKSCNYKNVLYEKYDDSKKRFQDTIDEKVAYAFSRVADKYDWVWPTRDRSLIELDIIYNQILTAHAEKADLITLYVCPSQGDDIHTADYTNANQYILEQFGNMTSLSATLFSAGFLKDLLKQSIEENINVGLWIPVAVFHCLANKSFKAKYIETKALFQNAKYDEPSFWLKNKSALKLWTERYPKMIQNLPAMYESEKEKLLTFTNFGIHPFCNLLLLKARAAGDFKFSQVFRYRKLLKRMAKNYYSDILLVSLLPSKLVALTQNEKTRHRPDVRLFRFLLRDVLRIYKM